MIDPESFLDALQAFDVESFYGVPDSLLKQFCACVSDKVDKRRHIITANEGNAVALASGYYLSTGRPSLVYLQNSGLGNIVNPILSLADNEVYGIPLLLLIGWRGEPGQSDEPQHIKQGRVTTALLEAMEIPWFKYSSSTHNPNHILAEATRIMTEESRPVALLVSKGTFSDYVHQEVLEKELPLSREQAIHQVLKCLPPSSLVISTTGMASREVFEIREKEKQTHCQDFLTVGSMGHASSIALGISLETANRPVVCLDGDGAMLMHLGSAAIVGTSNARSLLHIILNNSSHDSVGGQPTVGNKIDFCKIAQACGYKNTYKANGLEDIKHCVSKLLTAEDGPNFLEIGIRKGNRNDLGRPTSSPKQNKVSFMKNLMS